MLQYSKLNKHDIYISSIKIKGIQAKAVKYIFFRIKKINQSVEMMYHLKSGSTFLRNVSLILF